MIRPRLPHIGRNLTRCRRSLHSPPILRQDFRQTGVPGLLSKEGFKIAFTDYQDYMIAQLNRLTAGNDDYANRNTKDLITIFARDPNFAMVFNYASMSHNNHFFFESLSEGPHGATRPGEKLRLDLEKWFSSMESLKLEFIAHAEAMFGPGFVWLVKHNNQNAQFSILTTYLAGSPYSSAHTRRQQVDMNTESNELKPGSKLPGAAAYWRERTAASNEVGAHGPSSRTDTAPGGIAVTPILCLNTWEHVWLPDYGITHEGISGKRLYAANWWEVIDWRTVAERAGHRQKEFRT